MEIRLEKEAALIQTVLFLESEPMDEASIARATGLGKDVVEQALETLAEELASPAQGLELVRSARAGRKGSSQVEGLPEA